MVQNFTHLSLIESEMSPCQVSKSNTSHEDNHLWVVTISIWVKWIVSELVSVWLVMNTGLLFESMAIWVGREDVLMMVQWQIVQVSVWIVKLNASV